MKDLADPLFFTLVTQAKPHASTYNAFGCIGLTRKVLEAQYPEKRIDIRLWVIDMLYAALKEEERNAER